MLKGYWTISMLTLKGFGRWLTRKEEQLASPTHYLLMVHRIQVTLGLQLSTITFIPTSPIHFRTPISLLSSLFPLIPSDPSLPLLKKCYLIYLLCLRWNQLVPMTLVHYFSPYIYQPLHSNLNNLQQVLFIWNFSYSMEKIKCNPHFEIRP